MLLHGSPWDCLWPDGRSDLGRGRQAVEHPLLQRAPSEVSAAAAGRRDAAGCGGGWLRAEQHPDDGWGAGSGRRCDLGSSSRSRDKGPRSRQRRQRRPQLWPARVAAAAGASAMGMGRRPPERRCCWRRTPWTRSWARPAWPCRGAGCSGLAGPLCAAAAYGAAVTAACVAPISAGGRGGGPSAETSRDPGQRLHTRPYLYGRVEKPEHLLSFSLLYMYTLVETPLSRLCFGHLLLRCFDVLGSQIGSTESGNPVWTY